MATESDNVNSGALGTLVAVGTIAFFGIALVVTALVRTEMQEELEKKEVSADRAYRDLLADQTSKLAAPAGYVDRGKGLVSLPIDRAMELTVEGYKKDPSSATPAATAGGAGGAGGAGATPAGGGGAGGAGGNGGAGGTGGAGAKPADEAVHAEPKSSTEGQPAEAAAAPADEKKTDKEKKKAPKPAPVPPAPAAPAAPAPNGQ
jgi:hypothetical protein